MALLFMQFPNYYILSVVILRQSNVAYLSSQWRRLSWVSTIQKSEQQDYREAIGMFVCLHIHAAILEIASMTPDD